MQQIHLEKQFSEEVSGMRLDQALAETFSEYSRSRLKTWIQEGAVSLDGRVATKPREKVMGYEQVSISATLEDQQQHLAEELPLDIVYEDEHLLVINKPKDLVVHPGAGNPKGTLLNALLHHHPASAELPRAGIVHRLDKDTTGLMVVAKTLTAQTALVEELQAREITREYEAVVNGRLTAGGKVEQPIGRHPTQRTQMAVHPSGREAATHYRVAERYRAHTLIRLRLETGRTHQIRVHMSHLKHPLVGDPLYGGRARPPKGADDELISELRGFRRQALHARMLELTHPETGERVSWEVPMPDDMVTLIEQLRLDASQHKDEEW